MVERARIGRHLPQQGLGKYRADHGGFLECLAGGSRQSIDAGEQQTVDRERNTHRGRIGTVDPLPVLLHQHATCERAHHLLDEERIAPGVLEDPLPQLLRDLPLSGADQCTEQGTAVAGRQRLQPHDRLPSAADSQRASALRGAVRNDQHEATVLQAIDEKLQQFDRSCVRPVQILYDQHQRAVLQPMLDDVLRSEKDLTLELLGVDLTRARIFRLEPEQITK